MNYKPLEKGRRYVLCPTDRMKNEMSWRGGLGQGAVFIRNEYLPKTEKDWETFYTEVGGAEFRGIEDGRKGGITFRLRVPADKIIGLDGDRVIVDAELVAKIVREGDRHSEIVCGWLDEVKRLAS